MFSQDALLFTHVRKCSPMLTGAAPWHACVGGFVRPGLLIQTKCSMVSYCMLHALSCYSLAKQARTSDHIYIHYGCTYVSIHDDKWAAARKRTIRSLATVCARSLSRQCCKQSSVHSLLRWNTRDCRFSTWKTRKPFGSDTIA